VRQVGTVASEQEAKRFVDYLLAQQVPAKILTTRDGLWGVWVQNEDQVARGAEEFRAFIAAPNDPRYLAARDAAHKARRQAELVKKSHRTNTHDLRERWEGPSGRLYPLTVGLMLASIAVSLLTNFGRERPARDLDSLNRPTLERMLLFSDYTIRLQFEPPFVVVEGHGFNDILRGQVWRLITPIFLHFSVWHLVFNMSALRYFGGLIELHRGSWRLLVLVLVSAAASNVGECLIELQSRDVVTFGGMSGVCYALFGYLWMKGWAHPEEGLRVNDNTIVLMMVWFLLCFTQVLGPVANAAHGVGLVVGMALGLTRF
jgi:GlpG protein